MINFLLSIPFVIFMVAGMALYVGIIMLIHRIEPVHHMTWREMIRSKRISSYKDLWPG